MSRLVLTEATTATATPVEGKPGRFLIQLITPGWGSSGYYGAPVLEAAAKSKVFPAGTHMYMDHPTASEQYERPERSVRDLAAVLNEDASWNGVGLVAEATVFGAYRDALEQMAESIGVSIRTPAEVTMGEAEGRAGRIIEELFAGGSADFVTHAGRGGKVLQVIESARTAAEATANDTRQLLDQALTDAYGAEKVWCGVRDFDDTTVWFWQSSPDSEAMYALGYSLSDDGVVTLDGTPTEVRAVTTYVPVNPAGQSTTQESEEDPMATTQIEESDLARLREDASRVTTLEAERDTEKQRADAAEARATAAEAANAATVRATKVAEVIGESATEAKVVLDSLQEAGLATKAVVGDDGVVNEAETRKAVDLEIAKIAESNGAGRPRNFGGSIPAPAGEVTAAAVEAQLDQIADNVFGTPVKEA